MHPLFHHRMVHISEKTLSFLNGEFEVKDGDGAAREEAIRLAGVKTYLIVRTLKEWPEGTLDAARSPRPDSLTKGFPDVSTHRPRKQRGCQEERTVST